MWIVWDSDEGLIGIFDDQEEAIKEFNEQVERVKDYVQSEGEFTVDLSERVVLAKIEKQVYPVPAKHGAYGWSDEQD